MKNTNNTTRGFKKVFVGMTTAVMMMTMISAVSASAVEAQADNTTSITAVEAQADNTTSITAETVQNEGTRKRDAVDAVGAYLGDKSTAIAKTLGKKAIEKGIDLLLSQVPFGSDIAGTLKAQVLDLAGLGDKPQISTNELAEKLEALENTLTDAIDDQTAVLIDKMHDTFAEGTFRKDMDNLQSSVNIGNILGDCENSKFSEEDKLIKLAMITGNSTQWQNSGMLIKELTNVANDISGRSYMDKKNLFQLMYSNNTQNYKLSGEVMDVVNPYAVKIVIDYIKYAALTLSSLEAQQQILSEDFDASKITDKSLRKQYESFQSDETSIEKMKIYIQSTLFGADVFTDNGVKVDGFNAKKSYGSVIESYKEFAKTYRLTYLPSNKNLSHDFIRTFCRKLIDNDEEKTKTYGRNQKESTSKAEFEKRIQEGGNGGNTNCLTIEEMKDLLNHINKARKDGTAKDFLKKVGFNTDGLDPDNTYFVPGSGYYESDYGVNMCSVEWFTHIDLASLMTGEIKSVRWKDTEKGWGLYAIGDNVKVRFWGDMGKYLDSATFLLLAKASDQEVQDYQDSVEKLVCKDMDKEITADIN